jgi:hypothetical protein
MTRAISTSVHHLIVALSSMGRTGLARCAELPVERSDCDLGHSPAAQGGVSCVSAKQKPPSRNKKGSKHVCIYERFGPGFPGEPGRSA